VRAGGRIAPHAAAAAAFALLCAPAFAGEPYVTGSRTFPVTPTTDDPFVADEFSASATTAKERAEGDEPAARESEFELELEKRITDEIGIELEGEYELVDPEREDSFRGFNNFTAGVKYQFFTSDTHEAILSVGVSREFGGTGSESIASEVGATTPTFFFGKGFGDLPDEFKYLKPFAVTGTLGYRVPDQRSHGDSDEAEHFPDSIELGFCLEYSLRYLQGNVEYVGLPIWLTRMTPLVEVAYSIPAGQTFGQSATGVIAPGIVYSDLGLDAGIEALIPANRASGQNIGVTAKLAISLQRLGAAFLARPLFED
jgi:hypothetical protein